jgi:hypothetical protein
MYSIEQLAKKHLYTVPGDPYWEAAGYRALIEEVINICCSKVDHIHSHDQSIGQLIRQQFKD